MVSVAIREILDEPALRQVWPVMQQLRPHLSEQEFIDLVALMRPEGFRIAAAFDNDVCVAVAGFRIQHYLQRHLRGDQTLSYAGRQSSASPAVGYLAKHNEQQKELIEAALTWDQAPAKKSA